MNPYKILGVKKSATVEEIRAAWMRLVKQHHPDVGGDAEEFKKVQEAYGILINPETRRQYDETGFVASDPKSQIKQAAMQNLMVMFSQMLDQMPEEDFDHVDIIKVMRDASMTAFTAHHVNLDKLKKQQEKIARSLAKLRKRLKRKKRVDQNFIIMAVERKLEGIIAQQLQPKQMIEVISAAIKILDGFEYQFEPREMPSFIISGPGHSSFHPEQYQDADHMHAMMERMFRTGRMRDE